MGRLERSPHKNKEYDYPRTDTESNGHCPRKGWSISVEDENKTSIQFEFQRYTKYGQDFNFNADMQDEDIDTLIAGMKRYYEDFDPDYEAYLWIGDDGHGRNGAPYHIKDIVSDMEEAEEQIYELLQALEVEFI